MSAASRAGYLLRRAVRPADLTAARMSRRLNAGPRYGVELPRSGRTFLLCAMHGKGGADRRACIVRRGRYEHVGEFTGSPDQFIGHAIERDAAGKTQIVERHLAFDASYERRDRRICRLPAVLPPYRHAAAEFQSPCHRGGPNKASILANLSGLKTKKLRAIP